MHLHAQVQLGDGGVAIGCAVVYVSCIKIKMYYNKRHFI